MSAMIARYLKDFGAPVFPVADERPVEDGPFGFPALVDLETVADPETIRSEAFAEGHEVATTELTERHATEMAALAESHAAEMAALAEHYEAHVTAMIAERLDVMTEEVARSVTEATAQVLLPFLGELVTRKAIADLAVLLKGVIEEGEAGRIRLRGPESAFRRLAERMGDKVALLDFEESAEMDLTAEIGTAVLVTRLSAFAAGLEKVME
ncbi:hypothetical protein [Allorhizobium borbori]|uniref:Uncharacterized protein n=1 Tax=Allorhizobium borbori TaxID=485907 RepID=A0A7W6K3P0_9HYPH|nr:hypothetical protein [Allorhizobium borbori]MBB4104593.1 hypothetical protein [Allorhizobium borbori]